MAIRSTEVKMVRQLLESEEWEDETECAAAIIKRLDEMRGKERKAYCLVVQHQSGSGPVTLLYGPYPTSKQAQIAYEKGTGQVSESDRVAVLPLTTPEQAKAAREA